MRRLVAAKPAKVIVDVATNSGGNVVIAQRFMSYLLNKGTKFGERLRVNKNRWEPPANFVWSGDTSKREYRRIARLARQASVRNGQHVIKLASRSFGHRSHTPEIVVVVGPKTRSAATILAFVLKSEGDAKISGEIGDVSSRTLCSAAPGAYPLSHTGLKIRIPLVCFDRPRTLRDTIELLRSDFAIDPRIRSSDMLLQEALKSAFESN